VRSFHFLERAHQLARLPQPEWLQVDIERLRELSPSIVPSIYRPVRDRCS
jgi:hypothetical protein